MIQRMKRIIIFLVVSMLLLLVSMLILSSPPVQIYSSTGFLASPFVTQQYYYDAVGEGRDYNSIKIFSLSRSDQIRFVFFVSNHEEWTLLPLSEEVCASTISNVGYNPHMEEMLTAKHGFWYYEERLTGGKLFIYDADSGKLYLRNANCFANNQYQQETPQKVKKLLMNLQLSNHPMHS